MRTKTLKILAEIYSRKKGGNSTQKTDKVHWLAAKIIRYSEKKEAANSQDAAAFSAVFNFARKKCAKCRNKKYCTDMY